MLLGIDLFCMFFLVRSVPVGVGFLACDVAVLAFIGLINIKSKHAGIEQMYGFMTGGTMLANKSRLVAW